MQVFMHIMWEFYLLVHLILETLNFESNLTFEFEIAIKLKTEIRKKRKSKWEAGPIASLPLAHFQLTASAWPTAQATTAPWWQTHALVLVSSPTGGALWPAATTRAFFFHHPKTPAAS
jgi:hypothetical protein